MRIENEIEQLLSEGAKPSELVKQGYSRGTVYKIHKRRSQSATPTPRHPTNGTLASPGQPFDPEVESDPEILQLKKTIRIAELETRLATISGTPGTVDSLEMLEKGIENLYLAVSEL